MLNYKKLLLSSIISFFPFFSAHAKPWYCQDIQQNLVFSIAGGPTWASPGQSQEFYVTPSIKNDYQADGNITNNFGTAEIFFGFYRELNDAVQGQLGIELGYSGNASARGNILQNSDPEQVYYSYSYNMHQYRASVKGKIIFDDLPVSSLVQPYFAGSLGVGFNHDYGFQTTKLYGEAESTPQFTPKTTNAFTYTVGGGLQFAIDPFWQIGVGYELAGWGKNQLGEAPNQTLNQGHGLEIQNIYTSTALITLSYTS